MPANKDFKRVVRARMQKTGESYTAARAQLLDNPPAPSRPAAPAPADYARLGGMADETLKAKTGCTWERWVGALDAVKAYNWPHGEIAAYVSDKYGVPGWWTQMVTVGYERIKGLRDIGQRRGGSYEASKGRTFPVSLGKAYQAFSMKRERARWLDQPDLVVRKATRNKSMHITWPDGSSVTAWFIAKGRSKSQVAVAHAKLPNRAAVARMKTYWGERFDALAALLAG